MPLLKCSKCQHEWEGQKTDYCDWCNASDPYILEEKTPLEKMLDQEPKT